MSSDQSQYKTCIFLYANQPVLRYEGRYYTKTKNFVDFLAMLSSRSTNYRLILPCKSNDKQTIENLITINLPEDVIEVDYYQGHFQALARTFINAFRIRNKILRYKQPDDMITIAGPGPNSMLFLLSWLLPVSVRFAYFIRGDTKQTVNHIYGNRLLGRVATNLVGIFQNRIYSLLGQGRAIAFTYGERLKKLYGEYGKVYAIAPLIDEDFICKKDVVDGQQITKDRFKVLFVGRLSNEKGILELIAACKKAAINNQPFMLSIVGHGPLERKIKETIDKDKLESIVNFIGYVPHGEELIELYDQHDLLCLPSRTEGVPRVIVEAFARRLPVAATPVGSIPILFENDLCIIRETEPDAIAEIIQWCRENPEDLANMADRGPAIAKKYTLEYYADFVDKKLRYEVW